MPAGDFDELMLSTTHTRTKPTLNSLLIVQHRRYWIRILHAVATQSKKIAIHCFYELAATAHALVPQRTSIANKHLV